MKGVAGNNINRKGLETTWYKVIASSHLFTTMTGEHCLYDRFGYLQASSMVVKFLEKNVQRLPGIYLHRCWSKYIILDRIVNTADKFEGEKVVIPLAMDKVRMPGRYLHYCRIPMADKVLKPWGRIWIAIPCPCRKDREHKASEDGSVFHDDIHGNVHEIQSSAAGVE